MTPETLQATAEALQITPADVEALETAAAPLWRELDRLGWTDAYGGAEFERVFPVALATIRDHANCLPGFALPGWVERVDQAAEALHQA